MRVTRLGLLAAAVLIAACGDQSTTAPTGNPSYLRVAGDPPPDPPFIASATVAPTSLELGGRPGSYSVQVENDGTAQSSIFVIATVIQSSGQKTLESHAIRCGFSTGQLPKGVCTDQASFVVSNTANGWGAISPGPATVHVELRQLATTISAFDVPVTIVLRPHIEGVSIPNAFSQVIGALNHFTVVLANGGQAYGGVVVQNYIIQGSTRIPASGSLVLCAAPLGSLPTGTCPDASDLVPTSPLVPGPATAEVDLIINGVLFDTRAVSIWLVAP